MTMETFNQLIDDRERLVSKIKHALNEHNPDLEPAIASFYEQLEKMEQEIAKIGQQLIQEKVMIAYQPNLNNPLSNGVY